MWNFKSVWSLAVALTCRLLWDSWLALTWLKALRLLISKFRLYDPGALLAASELAAEGLRLILFEFCFAILYFFKWFM